jgi:hypothetical protein
MLPTYCIDQIDCIALQLLQSGQTDSRPTHHRHRPRTGHTPYVLRRTLHTQAAQAQTQAQAHGAGGARAAQSFVYMVECERRDSR